MRGREAFLVAGALLALAAPIVVGCSSSGDARGDGTQRGGPGAGEADGSTDLAAQEDALLGTSCDLSRARRYETILPQSLTCTNVDAQRGTWVARKIFEDGPEELRDRACRYTWRPTNSAGPDKSVLDEATDTALLTPSCSPGLPPTVGASAEEGVDEPIAPMGGAVGCDVCGVLRDGKAWIIRPPGDFERVRFRAYLKDARGNIDRTMQVSAESVRTPSMIVELPTPPTGRAWADSVIDIHGF